MRSLFLLICLIGNLTAAGYQRTCRILYLGAPADAPKKLFLFDGKTAQEVELPSMNFSPIYYLQSGSIVLAMLPSAPATPEKISADAPSVVIQESVTDIYLLLSYDPNNRIAPVKMQAIDVNPANFKKGQMLWFNLTNKTVGGQVGIEKLLIKPNTRLILKAPARGKGDYPVNLNFRIPGKPSLYPLCETRWQYQSQSRSVFFVVNQSGSRTPRIVGFSDFRARTQDESTAP